MHGPAGVLTVVLYETALGGLALLWLAPLWGVVRPGFFKLAGGTALACAVLAWLTGQGATLLDPDRLRAWVVAARSG